MKHLRSTLLLACLVLIGAAFACYLQAPTPTGAPPLAQPEPASDPQTNARLLGSAGPATAPDPGSLQAADDLERVRDRNAAETATLIATQRRDLPRPLSPVPAPRRVTINVIEANNRQTEWDLQLAPGIGLPAAILEHEETFTPSQLTAMDSITERFLHEATTPVANQRSPTTAAATNPAAPAPAAQDAAQDAAPDSRAPGVATETTQRATWDAAETRANETYRAIFGDEAFIRKTIISRREAMGIK